MRPIAGGPQRLSCGCNGAIGERRAELFDSPVGVIMPADVGAQTSQCWPPRTPAIVRTVQLSMAVSLWWFRFRAYRHWQGPIWRRSVGRRLRAILESLRKPVRRFGKTRGPSAVQQRQAAVIAEGSSADPVTSPSPTESAHAGRLALAPPDGRSPRLRPSEYRYRNRVPAITFPGYSAWPRQRGYVLSGIARRGSGS